MTKDSGSALNKLVTGNPLYDQELERAPWEIASDHYYRIDSPELIEKSLNVIKNDTALLVLASLDGQRYGNTILISFDQETLSIDMPNNFDVNTVKSFLIYFRDILGVWSFLQVNTISECDAVLKATYPETLYRLQRRQYQRVNVPLGTQAAFREEEQLRDGGMVKDISAGGMLIAFAASEAQLPPGTSISQIAITLPLPASSMDEHDAEPVLLPVIRKGRVVRMFNDSESNQSCYGIAFEADGDAIQELAGYIEVIKSNMPVKV